MIKSRIHSSSGGFSLVEVTLALGVAAFCLITLFGLLPVGVTSNQMAFGRTAAASVAANIVADLRATPVVAVATPSPGYGIPVPASATETHTIFLHSDGTAAVASGSAPTGAVDMNAQPAYNPQYRVTMAFVPPAAGQRNATSVRVLVTWPAMADPTAATTPSNFSGSLETIIALDRH